MILGQWQVGGRPARRRRHKQEEEPAKAWWCQVCDKPTELNVDGPANVCAVCGSPRVKLIAKGGDQ